MVSPSNESQDHWYAYSYEKVRRVHLVPFLKESEQNEDTARSDGCASNPGNCSTSALLVTPSIASIDEITTQLNLHAINKLSLPHEVGMFNELPLEEQETWVIPVLQSSSRDSRSKSQVAEGYSSHLRKLIKSSGVYALASFASPLVSLVLAPFLTHNLTRIDYGALAVLNTVVALLAGLTQLGLGSAFFRSYNFDYESQSDRLGVLSTAVILLLLVSIPVTISTLINAPWLATILFNRPQLANIVRLAALVVLLQNMTVPGFAWMRAEDRAIFYALLAIGNLIVNLIATILLVGVLHQGVAGSLIATSSGYAFVVFCTLPIILLRTGLRIRFDIAHGMLAFGLPNVANYVSIWILQLSDRFLLERLGSLTQTANYAVAYNLGSVLSIIVLSPFQLAWPSVLFTLAKRDDASDIFRLVFRWYSIVLLFAAFGLSLMCMVVFDILFPPAYHSAALIIPIISMSTMFYGIYNFLTLGIGIRRKTWIAVILTTNSALVNVGLNIILIPHYGSMGAAVSTLLAYMLLAGSAYVVNQRIYPIPFEIGKFIIALFVGIALYTGSSLVAQQRETYVAWGISFAAFCLYGGFLIALGKFLNWDRKA